MSSKMKLNPFQINTLHLFSGCSATYYSVGKNRHDEYFYCEFKNDTSTTRYDFFKNSALTTNWMELFGYGDTEWDQVPREASPLGLIKSAFTCIINDVSLLGNKKIESKLLEQYINSYDYASFSQKATSCLSFLEEIHRKAPALCYCYPMFFHVLKGFLAYYEGEKNIKETLKYLTNYLNILLLAVGSAIECYESVRSYTQAVLIDPYKDVNSFDCFSSPKILADSYKDYCETYFPKDANLDFYTHSVSKPFPNAGAQLENKLSDNAETTIPSWNESFSKVHHDAEKGIAIFTLNQYAHIGLEQLLDKERCIRKCKLCGKYFKVLYSTSQECCTRKYKNSKFACNEYASRKSAKDKFLDHPVNGEYKKSHNRLYARMLRGKVAKDSPLMSQLKSLHDEYYKLYEQSSSDDEKTAVINEYVQKNKELLG